MFRCAHDLCSASTHGASPLRLTSSTAERPVRSPARPTSRNSAKPRSGVLAAGRVCPCSIALNRRSLVGVTRAALPREAVRDLLGITRALYRAELAAIPLGDRRALDALEQIGRDLRTA